MSIAVIPDFESYVMAVDRVERLLHQVTQALDRENVPHAVIGGNAVAAWIASVDPTAARATKDVDILLRRDDLPGCTDALARDDFDLVDVHGVTMFLPRADANPKTGVHVVIANERVRPHESHPTPDVARAVRSKSGFLVLDLPSLVQMKLQAFRRIDQVHIEDLLAANLIDDSVRSTLPPDLVERLIQIEQTRRPTH